MTRRELLLGWTSAVILVGWTVLAIVMSMADAARQSTAPVALAPAADTTVVYRTILIGPPRPDTTLRYECKETK